MTTVGRQRSAVGEDWRRYAPLALSPILAAAQDAFFEKGFHGASVRDIAARVGQTVPALYYHHSSKEGIFVDLVDIAMQDLTWRTKAAAAAGAAIPEVRFANMIEAVVGHMTHRTKGGALDGEVRHLSAASRRRYAAQRKVVETLLDDIVEDGVRDGVFTAPHPIDAARAILGMCQAIVLWYRPDGPLTPDQVAQRYVELALMTVGATVH